MVASEKETPRCKATTTTKSLFELPRPRSRSSSAKMAAEAGYWHRRAVAMQRKSVCDRQVAHTKENDLLQAKEKIVAMEKQTRSLELQIQTMMKNTSTLGAEANEEVVTLEENEDKEATLAHLQVAENTAAEAKAKRNRDWQRNFFKWWWALDTIREQRKSEHKQTQQKAILEWRTSTQKYTRSGLFLPQVTCISTKYRIHKFWSIMKNAVADWYSNMRTDEFDETTKWKGQAHIRWAKRLADHEECTRRRREKTQGKLREGGGRLGAQIT